MLKVMLLGAMLLACGIEDLESGSKFISKTQGGFPHDDDPPKHRPGGAHANAYLINKVHKKDNDGREELYDDSEQCPDNRETTDCNLTAEVWVGYWYKRPTVCGSGCGEYGFHKIGDPLPSQTCNPMGPNNPPPVPCILQWCIGTGRAVSEVEAAIDKWLAPLRTPYSSGDNPIVSNSGTEYRGTFTNGGKGKADVRVYFACNSAGTEDEAVNNRTDYKYHVECPINNIDGDRGPKYPDPANTYNEYKALQSTKGQSCTWYNDDLVGTKPRIHRQPVDNKEKFNRPHVLIDDYNFTDPSSAQYDQIDQHDRLDLLRGIGEAFGLAKVVRPSGSKQPNSLMSGFRNFAARGQPELVLASDDKAGIQWLYEHHRNGINTNTCLPSDTYDTATAPDKGCVPKHSLITALKARSPAEALQLINAGGSGFNINVREISTGYAALHYAIIQYAAPDNSAAHTADYLSIIRKIIVYTGVNLNIKDNLGKTPLHLAVSYNKQDIVNLMINATGTRAQEADNKGNTALHYAAEAGHSHLVTAMRVNLSSYVSLKNREGRTALLLAAKNGHTDTVRAFSSYPGGIGTLSGAEDNDGNTALHLAAENGKSAVVALILSNDKTLLNDDNNRDETPLHLAAKLGREQIVTSLLQQNGIEINPQDNLGNTPLHLAAMNNRTAIVRLLLNKQGIDPAISNNNSKTARDEAVSRRYTDVVAVFDGGTTRYGTSAAQRLLQALKVGNVDPNEYCSADDTECRNKSALSILRADQNLDINVVEASTGNTPLHYAVRGDDPVASRRGPYETVIDLLLRRTLIKPNIKNKNGSAPLHIAVELDKLEVVKLLLRNRKLDANIRNNIGETALHIAVDLEHNDIVAELLRYRLGTIDVNLLDSAGNSALHVAAEQRSPTIAQMLVDDRRVDVNLRNRGSNETALHVAAEYNNDEVVRALLSDADIDVNQQDATGSTALHIAAHHGSVEVVTILLNTPNIDLTLLDNKQLSAYARAKANGKSAVVAIFDKQNKGDDVIFRGTLLEVLRDKDSSDDVEDTALEILEDDEDDLNVNEKDSTSGKTPLMYAIEYEYGRLVTALLRRSDLEVNLKANNGETALHISVKLQQASTIAALLRIANINVNLMRGDGDTALIIAVRANASAIVTQLAAHTAIDANRKDHTGNTPLHLAVKARQSAIVKTLLNIVGIEINTKDTDGYAPLHLATTNNDNETVSALLRQTAINPNLTVTGTEGETPLNIAIAQHVAAVGDYRATINLLLAHTGIDVNIENRHGISPLLLLVKEEEEVLITALLAHEDTEVNTKDSRNKTALMFAAERGSIAIVQQLLAEDDIDANLQDDKKFTALHFAAHRGHVEIVRLLLAHLGIDTTLRDNWKLTPRQRAQSRGHADVVAVFDEYEQGNLGNAIDLLEQLARPDREASIVSLINANRGNIAVNARDSSNNYTALHYAANLGYQLVINALLNYETTEVNALSTKQETPLHLAAQRGQSRAVIALLGHDSVQVNAVDSRSATPLHRAVVSQSHDTVQALLGHARIQPQLATASGHTALHWAAQLGHQRIAQALLNKHSALINMTTDSQRTALHYSAWFGHKEVVEALLAINDVNTNRRDSDGNTALHYAASYNRISIARALLNAGASNQISNRQRQRARDIAQAKGYRDMVALIDTY